MRHLFYYFFNIFNIHIKNFQCSITIRENSIAEYFATAFGSHMANTPTSWLPGHYSRVYNSLWPTWTGLVGSSFGPRCPKLPSPDIPGFRGRKHQFLRTSVALLTSNMLGGVKGYGSGIRAVFSIIFRVNDGLECMFSLGRICIYAPESVMGLIRNCVDIIFKLNIIFRIFRLCAL